MKRPLIFLLIMLLLLSVACNDEPGKQPSGTTPTGATPTGNATPPASNSTSRKPANLKYPLIAVGQTIPELKVADVQGGGLTLASRADQKGQLIVVYAPGCEVCHATIPRWDTLFKQFFTPRNIPFYGLSVQGEADTKLSIEKLNIPFKVVVMPDVDDRLNITIPDVPTTIAVGPDGKINGFWVGKLTDAQLMEIVKIFCPECNVSVNKQ